MKLNEYQEQAGETAVYPEIGSYPIGVFYATLGLAGEAGEVADQVKKSWRNNGELTDSRREKIKDELGDVMWYVAQLATELDMTLEDIATQNIIKLHERHSTNTVKHG